jgi:hypothetical protein
LTDHVPDREAVEQRERRMPGKARVECGQIPAIRDVT